jgi:hypothetical protein
MFFAKSSIWLRLVTASPRMPDEETPARIPNDGLVCAKVTVESTRRANSKNWFFMLIWERGFLVVQMDEKGN